MKALEKIGFGTVVAAAASIAGALTFVVKEINDNNEESFNKNRELQKKVDEYERRDEENQRKRLAELERKAAKYDEITKIRETEFTAKMKEIEDEIAKRKNTK